MEWIKNNWKRVLKYGGLGSGCLAVAFGGFILARYVASGGEFEGKLLDLVPNDVSVVMTVDNVPARKGEFERFLNDLVQQPALPQLERSSLWRDSLGKAFGESLQQFKDEKYEGGLKKARNDADQLGIELFKDVMADEVVVATDPGGESSDLLVLTRLARNARFKWQFLDIASGFFPDEPGQPKLEYSNGILKVTPVAQPDQPPPRTMMIAVLDDVLVVSNSARLMNGAVAHHAGKSKGISGDAGYEATIALVEPASRDSHFCGIWMNLDRLRERLPPEPDESGREVSPVDAYNSMPESVVAIYPDIFGPVNRIVSADVDSRPFRAAYYGIDISQPSQVTFDQYLLVSEDRIGAEEFQHLRETWAQPPAIESQLELLPPDTMLQVSYRQPLSILYDDVFDQPTRESLVGDFVVAMKSEAVAKFMPNEAEELVFAAVPRKYAPDSSVPLSGTDMPLPGFAIAFRTPGANPLIARALLSEYLQVQRGRSSNKPGDNPEEKKGPVQVVDRFVAGQQVYGFDDPREDDNFIRRLNRSIRAALVGEWLILTNSEQLLEHTIGAANGKAVGLAKAPGSAWRELSSSGSATVYLNFEQFVNYAASPELFKVLRDNKFNPTLPEGRDPRELREEIARELGYNPSDTASLTKPDVSAEYNRRKAAWEQKCVIEGDRYISELQADMNGLRYFRDLALTTDFAEDHLHVRGILRIGS
ncbi:MAG: hypothetical protein H6839_13895 [Planctomycetes bacterium]|nr:hypothetical protein [Planctomycetota bacterium]